MRNESKAGVISNIIDSQIAKKLSTVNNHKQEEITQLQHQINDILTTLTSHNQLMHDNTKQIQNILNDLSTLDLKFTVDIKTASNWFAGK